MSVYTCTQVYGNPPLEFDLPAANLNVACLGYIITVTVTVTVTDPVQTHELQLQLQIWFRLMSHGSPSAQTV